MYSVLALPLYTLMQIWTGYMELYERDSTAVIVSFWESFVSNMVNLLSDFSIIDETVRLFSALSSLSSFLLLLSVSPSSLTNPSLFSLSLPPLQRRREVVHTINDRIIIPLKKVGLSCYTLVRTVGALWTNCTHTTVLQSQWLHIMMYFFGCSCFQSGESYQRSLLLIDFW